MGSPRLVEVDSSGLRWLKSSKSKDNDPNCVEIAFHGDDVLVRDSKDSHGARLRFSAAGWAALLAAVRTGA
ncbi:DUF397 domain-containing protein [Amycolatopsis sp. YIM 10]|uniref:DUF397 domain-containing protein n=1 Tax=Amycolatopsis sp. YIM 10 TaxID=2653857 RepID=UPI0012A8DE4D|nr:DUF397 domain-containing protein [Amycolatopsis sp. YIM 10]QFU92349.1 hypothetical protein YIM_35950 [Amycolatopsis sp. YIM 10]